MRFTEREIKKIQEENFCIIIDTREKENIHIKQFFDSNNIKYKSEKMDHGDYTAIITANEEIGIYTDMYFPIAIERKNSIDEIVTNFSKDRKRLENEFMRSFGSGTRLILMIEDPNGYYKLCNGKYRSQYAPNAARATLKTFEARYDFNTTFINKNSSGDYIYKTLWYTIREHLKGRGLYYEYKYKIH